ncbi:cell wall-associated NlpC family hydrolase [Nocardia transvalensis]|uniref:Cell wall-associated NlpC family hydrolase n=1 Tax=Nocardia transvalensis TaxID=37333 RepID=A0A7W9UKU2_9NOCA|nr:C40 family peptidase [Nocardia transvalensis]MBB5916864.1 cell wall-associated NlpC family hydrolase [Nocardia transvalensis]
MTVLLLVVILGADPAQTCAAALPSSGAVDGPTGASVAGLSERQLLLARQGVAIGKQRRQPESVIVAELAAQATESTFRNLANPAIPESLRYSNDGEGHDHDSLGVHQMRASVYGPDAPGSGPRYSIAELMTPLEQINWFYDKAMKLPGAQAMSPAALAQEIERSAPAAYAGQLELARRLYAEFAGIDVASMPAPGAGQPPAGCGPDGTQTPPPAPAGEFGAAVIRAAEGWIGTDYVWGGGDIGGPTMGGFDCSGLTLYAVYQASGGRIKLPHYTQAQQDHPSARVVPFADRAPGDLIFFTEPGDRASHHVGILYGRTDRGEDLVLQAPQTGQTVTITPLSAWQGERMDIRRYDPAYEAAGRA